MSFQFVVLGLTVVLVLVLGILAVVSSTSGGVDWLQKTWNGKKKAPGATDAGSEDEHRHE
jgi:hypothetical protein